MNKKVIFATTAIGSLLLQSSAFAEPSWELGGTIEVEYSNSEDNSDIAVPTVELGIASEINEHVSGEIVLLYEEGETELDVDVATITMAPSETWGFTAGQTYVPFGVYDTNLVSDPLTLEIGETRESALQVDAMIGGLALTVYVFNGETQDDVDEDVVDKLGFNLGYAYESDALNISAAFGYISDIGETDTIQDSLGTTVVQDYVGGLSISANFSSGPFNIIAEYVTSTDAFDVGELAYNGAGAEPSAMSFEVGYSFNEMTVALGVQNTEEAEDLGLPEDKVLVAVSKEIMENTSIALEWASEDDYADESTDTVTVQLAVEF